MPRVTLSDYAKHKGVWVHAVEQAIRSGRIRRDPDGLIDRDQADADWEKTTNPVKAEASRRNGSRGQQIRKALGGKGASAGKTPAEVFGAEADRKAWAEAQGSPQGVPQARTALTPEPTDLIEYAKARAQREHYQAQRVKLDLEQKQGSLISLDAARRNGEEFYGRLKAALLSIPNRIADDLAADAERDSVAAKLEAEISGVLERHAGATEERLSESWGGTACR